MPGGQRSRQRAVGEPDDRDLARGAAQGDVQVAAVRRQDEPRGRARQRDDALHGVLRGVEHGHLIGRELGDVDLSAVRREREGRAVGFAGRRRRDRDYGEAGKQGPKGPVGRAVRHDAISCVCDGVPLRGHCSRCARAPAGADGFHQSDSQ